MNSLSQRSVLMRFSGGLPGTSRKDKRTTEEVKSSKGLGANSGRWVKELWPKGALDPVNAKLTEARKYHDTVTLPFGCKSEDADGKADAIAGIGILPASLLKEYADKMRQFKGELDHLVESGFLANPQQWVDWAVLEHNGTFDPANYPGCTRAPGGPVVLDADEFRSKMRKKFYLRTEPLPVPHASHFEQSIAELLGADADSVNLRVADAEVEARREVVRRMVEPVRKMAAKLAEKPKLSARTGEAKADIVFRDTLIENIRDIVKLVPALNITGDPAIDGFVREVEALTKYTPEALRSDKATRDEAQRLAAETLRKLEGYQF